MDESREIVFGGKKNGVGKSKSFSQKIAPFGTKLLYIWVRIRLQKIFQTLSAFWYLQKYYSFSLVLKEVNRLYEIEDKVLQIADILSRS